MDVAEIDEKIRAKRLEVLDAKSVVDKAVKNLELDYLLDAKLAMR